MLDPKFIRDNLDAVANGARQKNFPFDPTAYAALFDERLQLLSETQELARRRNEGSEAVKKASKEQRDALIAQMRAVGQELSEKEGQLRALEERFEAVLLTIPAPAAPETPIGASDADNVEWRKEGTPRAFDFPSKDHMEIGTRLGLVDFERGTQVSGSRGYFLTGLGALLERAVHSLALDLLVQRGFTPMSVPVLVRTQTMQGTGYLPLGADQAYHVEKDEMWLVGTSEVPMASFRANEIIAPEELPLRYCAHSSCFRREAGAHGKDTKGLYRVHQFQKIEQVIICRPDVEESNRIHDEILKNAEDLLQLLELPYRVVKVCTGDLGQGQVKKHDIETWMPSRNGYGETHSCSSFYDFQARRLKIRTRDANGKPVMAYTLNNTMAATPRLLIALLENHQTSDGRVAIPKALQPYMGGRTHIG